MWSKIEGYIRNRKLLNSNDLYIVGLSGGADSVALLLLLKEAGFNVHAAHCNFLLRGAESDRDEAFCVSLCQQLGVELHRVHFDTHTYAESHHVSIEMAARELRYGWFARLCQDIHAAGVCVAHHRDDSVETVLLNLVRGTGLRGLMGIQPLTLYKDSREEGRAVRVIRPLLCVSRVEIEDFLAGRGQEYVTDSTNLDACVLRNKIRLQVLPLLRDLNPAIAENIQRMTENVGEAQAVLDTIVGTFNNSNTLELKDLEKHGSSEYIVYEWLKNYGFNGSQVRQILDAETGGIVRSDQDFEVLKDRDRLVVEPALESFKPMLIPEEGTYVLNENLTIKVRKCAAYVSKMPDVATLDADKVRFPLTVRRVEEGDWMIPYGMKGRKLLSDLMTDCKMSVFEKRRQLVVVDAQGVIVWAVGLRTDQRVAVTEQTREVLEIRF